MLDRARRSYYMTSADITHAAWMRSRGISYLEIAGQTGFGEETIRENLKGHPLIGSSVGQFQNEGITGKTAFYNRARANVLHLMDLKNAGHSPTRTEANIPPDGKIRPTAFTGIFEPFASCCGSPAACCMEG